MIALAESLVRLAGEIGLFTTYGDDLYVAGPHDFVQREPDLLTEPVGTNGGLHVVDRRNE